MLAVAGLFGIWEAREFIAVFPFNFQVAADFFFTAIFIYLAWRLPKLLPERIRFVHFSLVAAFVYIVLGSAANLLTYIQALGLETAAERAALSPSLFLGSQFVVLLLVPGLVFGVLLWLIQKR